MSSVGTTPEIPEEIMPRGSLHEVVWLFLRLGFTAFGGPAAHIAMMRQEVVQRRHWLSDARFADLLGVVNLIPGPNSTELGIYLGYLRAGWPGLVLAGACFIGPAMLIVLAFAWAYVSLGSLPSVGWFLYGVKPVVVAIIAQALAGLLPTVLRSAWAVGLAMLTLAGFLLGWNIIALLFGAGIVLFGVSLVQLRGTLTHGATLLVFGGRLRWQGLLASVTGGASLVAFSQLTLFLTFLKIGAVLYGSGYVLLAFLHNEFVVHLGWLTDRQLLDAISVGQFTPGPVFTTATFIGYILGGMPGALLATLGIFLPAFVFVPLIHPIATRIRRLPLLAAFLNGVNAAALALMAGVLLQLSHNALVDAVTVGIVMVAVVVLLRFPRLNTAWLILGGGLIGLLVRGL